MSVVGTDPARDAGVKLLVVGAGVSGLTCAVALLEAGADVTVVTASAPAGTVSAVAGAMLGPVFGSGDERSLAWEQRSDAVFRQLANDPATGVHLVNGRLLSAPELGPGLPPWAADVPGYHGELVDAQLPNGFTSGFAAQLPFADMPSYLAWLTNRIQTLGGRVEQRLVTDLAKSGTSADYVINCSGLGSVTLADDDTVEPVWGQHVVVSAPAVTEFVMEGGGPGDCISVVPHRRGVLLGGVRRRGCTELMPDHQIATETIARASLAIPVLATAPVLGIEVGLRPARSRVRLETQQVGDTTVIHNYGHDGSGVFWSWGCAAEVVSLCGIKA